MPKRVVITNGRWLILFVDPADSFLESGSFNPAKVYVYKESEDEGVGPDEIEAKFEELFELLEHRRVLGTIPPLIVGEIAFFVQPEFIDRVMHGLHLKYIEHEKIYSISPAIHVSPIVFLRSRFGAWICVESRWEESIPHRVDEIPDHLENVDRTAKDLLADITSALETK